jgi:hypothetical protein
VHIAGGSEFLGYWLDAHSGEVPAELLAVVRRILPELPELRAVVFEITATFLTRLGLDGVRRQLSALREIWEQRSPVPPRPAELRRPVPVPLPEKVPAEPGWTPREWEDGLAALVVGRLSDAASPVGRALAGDPGIEVLRRLVWNFRSGVLVETLGLTCRLLLLHGGDPFIRELFDGFFASAPPELFASVEAEAFGAWLDRKKPDVPFLDEILGFERAALRAVLEGKPQLVPFRYEPGSLLEPLSRGRLPESPVPGRYEVEVTPDAGTGTTAASGLISSS